MSSHITSHPLPFPLAYHSIPSIIDKSPCLSCCRSQLVRHSILLSGRLFIQTPTHLPPVPPLPPRHLIHIHTPPLPRRYANIHANSNHGTGTGTLQKEHHALIVKIFSLHATTDHGTSTPFRISARFLHVISHDCSIPICHPMHGI